MEFTSYQLVGENTASLNTGSYLNRVEYSMFTKGFASDLWYGFSANDAIEIGVWDRNENLIAWQTVNQSKSYNAVTLSYTNTLNFPVTYSYLELKPDFILYKNEKVLVNPAEELSASFRILSGSYFLTYNFVREMAGTITNPLVIKDISPSRRELKLVPLSSSTPAYNAFCQKKVLMSDVSSLYIETLKGCPYSEIYSKISPLYPSEIAALRTVFFLTTEAATVQFFRNLYEDLWIYTSTGRANAAGEYIKDTTIRVQGIQTYFTNYLLSNGDTIVDFAEIDGRFQGFVSASIERKFAPIGPHPIKPYVDTKAFVFDFFTKYFYTPIAQVLSSTYKEKYYSNLKNALNLGDNRLLPVINNGVMDERVDPTDPLTLLLKLQTELPNDIEIQSPCWVSNISLTPYVVSSIIKSSKDNVAYKIGPPNFSIPIPNASLTNTNLSYTADDLREDDETSRELTISKNVEELSVDYTEFTNFVVFSSAELRLKIFKNKVINISALSSSLNVLNGKNTTFLAASGSTYPYYTQEYSNIQGQVNEIVNSFDGYESYLYREGSYAYNNGFVSASYVTAMDQLATSYDKTNRDSLINNCPEHILTNSENDDYIIFLSMIGHFFDNIYIYIANMPSEKKVGNSATETFTRRVVDYMLQAFGWNLDDSLEQSNILNNYLTSEQIAGLNSMSAEERLKEVRNRVLINLPQIYKTKGTEEAVRMILACYGIPSALLSVREYGGVNYTDEKASYTTYERVYMRQWDTGSQYDTYYLQCPTGSHTFLYKFCVDDASSYKYGVDHALVGNVDAGATSATSIAGAWQWASGFVRTPKKDSGKVFFRVGDITGPVVRLDSPEFPLFDGEIYSVMLRRNPPDPGYEYSSNPDIVPAKYDLYVQRNEGGEQILRLTSSVVCYDTSSNAMFSAGGWIRIGGWFTYWNQGGYTGCFDKFQQWLTSLSDADFEDYVNNINSYAFSGSNPHESLMFRMHYDYPVNQRQYASGSGHEFFGIPNTDWLGLWRNGNPFFATGSQERLTALYGAGANIDYMVNWGAWEGAQTLVTNSCSPTGFVSASCYPYQFRVIDYPSTWGISKYGPNKFRNEKIRHVSQSVEARFDNLNRSTYVPASSIAPDSNQVGFFVDPQDFKNRDIVRYLGNFDLMDSIGDPSNQFSQSYISLRTLRKEYEDAHAPLSGSKTLFNELCTLYKLYFNRSVFEAIKNVIPARSNVLVGVLIEPTILERPKYQSKEVFGESNTGSVLYIEVTASHYAKDPTRLSVKEAYPEQYSQSLYTTNELYKITASYYDMMRSASLELSYIGLPNRNGPVNHGGNNISYNPDPYMMGHFAGGVLTNEELSSLLLLPTIAFEGVPVFGYAPLSVQFYQYCSNANSWLWNFGDSDVNPSPPEQTQADPLHIYDWAGIYSVSLTATSIEGIPGSATKAAYITVVEPTIIPDFEAFPLSGVAGNTQINFTNLSTINNGQPMTYLWKFGDGNTSTDTNPSAIVYADPGYYSVELTASCGNYWAATKKENYIFMDIPAIPCGTPVIYSGAAAWPYFETRTLGTDIGVVTLDFDTYDNPDRIMVLWNGNVVIDTGWAGYNSNIAPYYWQTTLNNSLIALGFPGTASITEYSSVSGHHGQGSLSFNKTTPLPATVDIYVWAPNTTTGWQYNLSCPVETP